METPRPYLIAALICEKVLQEKDGSLSIIRIADKLMYEMMEGAPEGARPTFQLEGLVSIKSGPATRTFNLRVVFNSPSGNKFEPPSSKIVLEGGDHGQNLILKMVIGLKEDGLYWLDVMVDSDVLTRIPLLVERKPTQKSENR